ncbi:hypothetical protein [Pseudorhodoplanes sp.]|uniref:hypothetical protein n=1 Tax=Pseudorhodoplanes sp. TaxID=1934341 RepID=UPI002BDA372D|nr:hypothetical protein [Pseudorhodoplanes sp.]HWV55060.1 hypothetical protein [Pseudorhodoplanes sp.]
MTHADNSASISTYQNRLIGFFDVLGFSKLLTTQDIAELHHEYAALIDRAKSKIFTSHPIAGSPNPSATQNFEKAHFLFDSLVIVSLPIDAINVKNFIFATIQLMEEAFEKAFFLRGCVSLGSFLDDPHRNIFLSREFPALVTAEKQQEWLGVFVHPSAENLVLSELLGPGSISNKHSPLIHYDVPLKNSLVEGRWCLNWPAFIATPILQKNSGMLISPKRENTEAFIDFVAGLPDDAAPLPSELLPATHVRFMKARAGFRTKICDADGFGVVPNRDIKIAVYDR